MYTCAGDFELKRPQEMTGWKGFGVTTGWSALGGQTQSPYIVGGFKDGDKLLGHSVSESNDQNLVVVVSLANLL